MLRSHSTEAGYKVVEVVPGLGPGGEAESVQGCFGGSEGLQSLFLLFWIIAP